MRLLDAPVAAPAPGHGTRSRRLALRQGLLLAPWLLRSRRHRVALELGRHPVGPFERGVVLAAGLWLAACSTSAGALVAALGAEARVAGAAVVVSLVLVALLPAGAVQRTQAVGLVRSAYATEGPWRTGRGVSLVVADAFARLAVGLLGVLVAVGPALLVAVGAQWGPPVALAVLAAAVLGALALGLLVLAASLARLGVSARLAASTGYHADLLLRAVLAGGVAGCGAHVAGRLVRSAEGSAPTQPLLDLDVSAPGALVALGTAAAALALAVPALARVAGSAGLERSLRRLAATTDLDAVASGARDHGVPPALWHADAVAAKERALVRRTRSRRRSGADGLVGASAALVGAAVGLLSSGLVPSATARLTALTFALLIVAELVGDGLRRVDSVDADGRATTWLLGSRRHVDRLVQVKAARHARSLATVVALTLVAAVAVVPLAGPHVLALAAAGSLAVLAGTVGVVGATARHPRWDWADPEEIGMHPSAQGLRFATTGLLWMVAFCLISLAVRASPASTDPLGERVSWLLGAGLVLLGAPVLAPRGALALARSGT